MFLSSGSQQNRMTSDKRSITVISNCGLLILALCALLAIGCSSGKEHGDVPNGGDSGNGGMGLTADQCMENQAAFENASLSSTGPDSRGYRIQAGDQLAIDFYLNSEFNDNVSVQPDGRIVLRLVGPMQAAGLTPGQLANQINEAYAKELKNPGATVHVQNMPSRQIYVQGQVSHPGSFVLQPGMTALQAVADAGGLTDDAKPSNVVLIRRDACGRAEGSRLDLASAADNPSNGEDVLLMPHDTLIVPRSRIANMDLFVQQYIRGLLPVQPYLTPPIP
jgi:polysaccharide export outer membrane protein